MGFKGTVLNDNIVIKETERKNETTFGIDLTSEADKNEKYRTGVVVGVGHNVPKKEDGTPFINIGNNVVFDKYKQTPFSQDGNKYVICYYSDLLLSE